MILVHIICTRKILDKTLIAKAYTQKGSGIYIGNGNILTNYHVVPNTAIDVSIYSPSNGNKYKYMGILGYSKMFDLCLIKTDMSGETYKFGSIPNIGDDIKILGFLHGNNLSHIISEGKIMSFDTGGILARHDAKCLYVFCSAHAGPGFSGGPVLNNNNEIVGIVSARLSNIGGMLFTPSIIIENFLQIIQTAPNADEKIAFSYLRTHGGYISKNVDCYGLDIGDKIISINGHELRNGLINLKYFIPSLESEVFVLPHIIYPLLQAGEVLKIETDKGLHEHTLRSVADYFGNDNYKVLNDLLICDIYNYYLIDSIVDDLHVYYKYGKPTPIVLHSFNPENGNFINCHIVDRNTTDETPTEFKILYNYAEMYLKVSEENKYIDICNTLLSNQQSPAK